MGIGTSGSMHNIIAPMKPKKLEIPFSAVNVPRLHRHQNFRFPQLVSQLKLFKNVSKIHFLLLPSLLLFNFLTILKGTSRIAIFQLKGV